MKGYKDVNIVQFDRPLEQFPDGVVPVAVELRPNSERLPDFVHPPNAVYVFGPEDGSISGTLLSQCHRFLVVPVKHCLNLATAVATILYDRSLKVERGSQIPPKESMKIQIQRKWVYMTTGRGHDTRDSGKCNL